MGHRKMFMVYLYVKINGLRDLTDTKVYTDKHVYAQENIGKGVQQNRQLFLDDRVMVHFSPCPLFLVICILTFLQLSAITSVI